MMPVSVMGMINYFIESEGQPNRSNIEREIINIFYDSEDDLVQLLELVAAAEETTNEVINRIDFAKTTILGAVLSDVRTAIDIGLEQGTKKINLLIGHLEQLISENSVSMRGAIELANVWLSSGFDAPKILARRDLELVELLELSAEDSPEELRGFIHPVLEDIRATWNIPHVNLNFKIPTFLAVVPPKTRKLFTQIATSEPEEIFGILGCNLLLSKEKSVRKGAIKGLNDRLEKGILTEEILTRIEIIRSWIKEKTVCEALDRISLTGLNAGLGWRLGHRYLKIKKIFTCFPDGRGSQSIYIMLQSGVRTMLVTILVNEKVGIKEAFIVPTESVEETEKFFGEIESDIDCIEVSQEFMTVVSSMSLAEGFQNETLPDVGFIDVLQTIKITDVYPQDFQTSDILARADPANLISKYSARKISSLVKASENWLEKFPIGENWFEDDDYSEATICDANSIEEMESNLWNRLGERREYWSRIFARVALVAHYAKLPELPEFLVVAHAIKEGVDLRKIPIMNDIFQKTLIIWDLKNNQNSKYQSVKILNYQHPKLKENNIDDKSLLELNEALQYNDRSVNWLDGYIVASFAAPKQLAENEFLAQTEKYIQRGKVKNISKLKNLISNILRRFDQISRVLTEAQKIIVPSDQQIYSDWARGFLDCWNNNPCLWPQRTLGRKGQKIKRMLEKASVGESGPNDPRVVANLMNELF